MPKSEFVSPLAVKAGKVTVAGVVGADVDAGGRTVARDQPVHVHWVLEQGNVVAQGQTDAPGEQFTDEEAKAQPWRAGPARVSGVAVLVRQQPVLAFETFTWFQEVELKLNP